MSKKLAETFYQQRAFWGNIFVFVGFLIAMIDSTTQITIMRLSLGFFLALSGFGFRIWASGYVWPNIAQPLPETRDGLITAGPYAYVRNPIYFGAILMIGGVCLSLGSWWTAIIMLVPTIFMHTWHSLYEESYMAQKYGQVFVKYKSCVPRFIPKVWAPYPTQQGKFSLSAGIQYDIGPLSAFVLFFVGVALYLVLLHRSPSAIDLVLLLVGSILFSFVIVFWVQKIIQNRSEVKS